MSSAPVVCVTIPTYNCADTLDATVRSVLAQKYDQEKIIILFADFGSTDGTLEKILEYRREWTGCFSLPGRRIGRTMTAEATALWDLQACPGTPLLLWPGDTVYPHCFATCAEWFKRAERQRFDVSFLALEADIREADGTIHRQTPLFSGPGLLRAYSEDSLEYVRKGWRHAILPFGRFYSPGRDKPGTLFNLDFWWCRLAYAGFENNVLYSNEPLACLKIREPEDELDDVLFAFEQALTMFRMIKEMPDNFIASDDFERFCRLHLARYAVWRSFVLHARERHKDAEDCFLLARIICPAITEEECWPYMERLLEHGDESGIARLSAYFAREEASDKPKWPMGGALTRAWRRVREICSREKKSRFSEW